MHIGKSLKMALAKKGMRQQDLAKQLEVTHQYVNQLARSPVSSINAIVMLSEVFGMKVSEFVALGED